MSVISIKSQIRNYTVEFIKAEAALENIDKSYKNVCYIIDENVWNSYKDSSLRSLKEKDIIIFQVSEERKNLQGVKEIYDELIKRPAKRNTTLVSIGGGILQDVSGFAASTIYRGIGWVYIPTTLLAQADSCIGGKTSLNYEGYKNLIGTFYPPAKIYIDSKFTLTLKEGDFFSGLGEVVKLHLMNGEKSVQWIEKEFPSLIKRDTEAIIKAVETSLKVKKEYIEGDEFDSGRRNLLNYGHCVGHALESTSNFEIPHGQAIVVGMAVANIISENRGLLSKGEEERIWRTLLRPSLQVALKGEFFDEGKVIEGMQKDKKRTGKSLAIVLLEDGYNLAKYDNLTNDEVKNAIRVFQRRGRPV